MFHTLNLTIDIFAWDPQNGIEREQMIKHLIPTSIKGECVFFLTD
ncbi:hypothetical protein HanIR_Chr01g0042931 [Helianthus annuus]|nr:hypothetical protein HanIR_Chr01g0042931 [Helianthus annuus]